MGKIKVGDKVIVMGLKTKIERIDGGKFYFKDEDGNEWYEVESSFELIENNNTEFDAIRNELVNILQSFSYEGDLGDLGNEIGIILGKYTKEGKVGYELSDFEHGIRHGVSLTDGTHFKK